MLYRPVLRSPKLDLGATDGTPNTRHDDVSWDEVTMIVNPFKEGLFVNQYSSANASQYGVEPIAA